MSNDKNNHCRDSVTLLNYHYFCNIVATHIHASTALNRNVMLHCVMCLVCLLYVRVCGFSNLRDMQCLRMLKHNATETQCRFPIENAPTCPTPLRVWVLLKNTPDHMYNRFLRVCVAQRKNRVLLLKWFCIKWFTPLSADPLGGGYRVGGCDRIWVGWVHKYIIPSTRV